MSSTTPVAGHVLRTYLPRSATFIYTALRFQRAYRPVAMAGATQNLDEFPIDEVVELGSSGLPAPRKAARRASAYLHGYSTTFEHRLADEARRRGCAVLHAHFAPTALRCLRARRRTGIPLITTFYGFDLTAPLRNPEFEPRYRELFAGGELFLCEGPAMAAHLGRLGCPEEKVRIVKIGLDLDQFPFEPRPRRTPMVILQTGRFVEKKGVDLSIRAFAQAGGALGDSELWLIGDGPLRPELERLAGELGVSGRVRFMGSVSHEEYRQAVARADLGIQPSRTAPDGDTEGGAPTVILEMQAAGIPVVATTHADIPAVVPDEELLAPEEDVPALAAVLERAAAMDDAEWRQRAERGRALVEDEHDARKVARSLESIYGRAVDESST